MADIMRTGLAALTATQRALATASHNIANANTLGYTRQRVELLSRRPEYIGGTANPQYVGNGVDVGSITRVYDQFLTEQVRNYGSSVGQLETQDQWISQLDGVLGDGTTGLAPALKQFFASAQDVANSPASLPARQALLGQAETLASQFNNLDSRMNALRDGVNQSVSGKVTEINVLTESIAKANQAIANMPGGSTGAGAPDLMDQRDQLVADLAKKVPVSTVIQSDGTMSVFIGNGQTLVMGFKANTLETKPSTADPRKLDIQFKQGGSVVTQAFSGGEMGGLLNFQNQVLDSAQNKLGLMAAGLASTFNTQHKSGKDLSGVAGVDFFNEGTPTVGSNSNNTSAAAFTATITDISKVQPSTYEVKYDGANYSAVRVSDQKSILGSGTLAQLNTELGNDGLNITLTGSPAVGDRFLIQPTPKSAAGFKVLVTDPAKFAAADTTLTAAGTAEPGNNGNALKLAGLQTSKTLLNSSSAYLDVQSLMVSEVGTQGMTTRSTLKTQEALQTQATEARDSISGVNLDEEAANLMKYQRSYEAAAKVIQIGDSLIQTLLGVIGR